MNHGSFYLHFKALEHSHSLKKGERVVPMMGSDGFINIPRASPGGAFLAADDTSLYFPQRLSHSFPIMGLRSQERGVRATLRMLFNLIHYGEVRGTRLWAVVCWNRP